MSIEITDFRYKDRIAHGDGLHKKVIAQQVEKVFPQAVSQAKDMVPDFYREATVEGGWVALANDLKPGDRVRLIGDSIDDSFEVLEATPDKFRTAFAPKAGKAFVWGREVKDFRSVDYEAIAMLNVSATQQLKREKDAEVAALRAENAALRERLSAVEGRDRDFAAKFAALEKLVAASAAMAKPAAARTGAAEQQ
jgi:hypothetical protein